MRTYKYLMSMFFVFISTMLPISGWAGGSAGGGADLVSGCKYFSSSDAILADLVLGSHLRKTIWNTPVGYLYSQSIPDFSSAGYVSKDGISEVQAAIISTIFDYIALQKPQESQQVKTALDSLKFVPAPMNDNWASETPPSFPTLKTGVHLGGWVWEDGCYREGLAFQNYDTHTVTYSTVHYSLDYTPYIPSSTDAALGAVGRAFFRVHEGYVRLGYDQGKDLEASETYARSTLSALINSPDFSKRMIEKVYQLESTQPDYFFKNYKAVWTLAQRSTSVGLLGVRVPNMPKTLKAFKKIITDLELPCEMHQEEIAHLLSIDYSKVDKISEYYNPSIPDSDLVALCRP